MKNDFTVFAKKPTLYINHLKWLMWFGTFKSSPFRDKCVNRFKPPEETAY